MPTLYTPSDFSFSRTPMALRVGAGLLVLALHAAFAGALMLSKPVDNAQKGQESVVMVSVIEAPAPASGQAKAEPQIHPVPAPVSQPPRQIEQPLQQVPQPPQSVEQSSRQAEQSPQPIESPTPAVNLPSKPFAKSQPAKPQPAKPRLVPHKPQSAQRQALDSQSSSTPQASAPPTAPPSQSLASAPESQPSGSQTQALRQTEPILVNNIEFDGPRPIPDYPMTSRIHREEGRVVVLVRITAQGSVEQAAIDTSSGFSRLDDAALTAARQARFKPLIRNGAAVSAQARLPFDFKIRN